jgi:hypothetical protein
MSIYISLIFTILTSVIPTENRTTLSEAEGDVRLSGGIPTNSSCAMPHPSEFARAKWARCVRIFNYSITKFPIYQISQARERSRRGTWPSCSPAARQPYRTSVFASRLHEKERDTRRRAGCRGICSRHVSTQLAASGSYLLQSGHSAAALGRAA